MTEKEQITYGFATNMLYKECPHCIYQDGCETRLSLIEIGDGYQQPQSTLNLEFIKPHDRTKELYCTKQTQKK